MSNGPDRSQQTQIIIAVLGFLGVVVAALISSGALNKLFSSPSQPPTVVVVVTATSAPDVAVPTFTATPQPPVDQATPTVAAPQVPTDTPPPTVAPTLIPGKDWEASCISSLTWIAYPESANQAGDGGCIVEPVGGMFTSSAGHLNLLFNSRADPGSVYGLFTKLPQEGNVKFTLNMQDLGDLYGEIWIGVFSKPTIDSDGMVITIPPGTPDKANNITKYVFVQKKMPGLAKIQGTDYYGLRPAIYNFSLDLTKTSIHTKIDTSYPWNEYITSFTEKWLFIGYQAKNGTNKVKADFYNLSVTP